jgi:Domain of unknown function (DUF4258)
MPEYSRHAKDRMTERGITDAHVRAALKRRLGPPQPGDNGNIVVLGYGSGSRILKVVLSPDQATIVSVMWRDE